MLKNDVATDKSELSVVFIVGIRNSLMSTNLKNNILIIFKIKTDIEKQKFLQISNIEK